MTDEDGTARLSRGRSFGAALGATAGLSAGYGALWSGVADAGWHIWAIAILSASLLGTFTWDVFRNPETVGDGHWFFASLFGAAVGLLAGAFAAYPFGALFGAPGGAVGAAVAFILLTKTKRANADSGWMGYLIAGSVGGAAGLLVVAGCAP